MNEIPHKPKKKPKILLKPKNYQNTPLNLKILTEIPHKSKMTKIPPKPKNQPKYLLNLKMTKIPSKFKKKNDQNTP